MSMLTDHSVEDICTSLKDRVSHAVALYVERVPSLELKQAIQYTISNGGKRLRPLIVYATGFAFKADVDELDAPAAALELIHTYSLIHDDLPCMDNAALRRGKPTSHTMFGDALALLAGDALHTLAFQILAANPSNITPIRRLQMIETLADAAGPFGMAAGQAMDIVSLHDVAMTPDICKRIYHYKTGMLIQAAVQLGYFAGKIDDEKQYDNLCAFGSEIGLAFQIQDDLLDIESTTTELGKDQGIDSRHQKMTYPQLVGLSAARDEVEYLYNHAFARLDYLGPDAQFLRELVTSIWHRKS